jgi:hypothetical protein
MSEGVSLPSVEGGEKAPVRFGLWRIDGDVVEEVAPHALASEERLEDIVHKRPEILGLGDLLLIGRQVITDYGKRIDILAIDPEGDLVVIELKRERTPREVVAQVLEYGFWVEGLSYEEVADLYARHHDGDDFDSAFSSRFESESPETVNTEHKLFVLASGIDSSTEQIVEYLRGYLVPVNVLLFTYLNDGGHEYLARSWLTDPEVDPKTAKGGKKQAPWNGVDFFVAVGDSEQRRWTDMRRFGFVSAGHGEKYRKAMERLPVGARVWACVPSSRAINGCWGYVGVGTVTEKAVGVEDFTVDNKGRHVNILDAPTLDATAMGEDRENPDEREYLARIGWIDARAPQDGYWETGFFANQNVVAKLRQPFTLERLADHFDLGDS